MHQESPASNSDGRVKKRWIALGLIILAFVFWKGMHPTYQGHGMQYWFDVYTKDGVQEHPHKPIPPLTSAQKEALDAFQHFGTDGLNYLIDLATQDYKPSKFVEGIESILESLPWRSRGSFEMARYHQIVTSWELLRQLGVPFELAQSYGESFKGESDPKILAKAITPFQWVTNNFDEVGNKISYYLDHENSSLRWNAHRALENMSVSTEIHAKDWAERLTEHANYYLMAKWAKKSSVFEEDLLTRSQSSKPRESFKAIACLATAFPDAPKYRKQLLEHLTITPKSTASEAAGVQSNIYFLIAIDFPFQTIYPELIEIAKNADMALLAIAELLQDENLDVKPLLSSLEKVLAGAATKYHHFNQHLTASLFLLQQELHDAKAWSSIEQACAGPVKGGTQQDQFIGIVQSLAPHCKEAQDIIERNPGVSKKLRLTKISAANFRIRQYGLSKQLK